MGPYIWLRSFTTSVILALVVAAGATKEAAAQNNVRLEVGEASGDRLPTPLSNQAGDAANGRAIVLDRRLGNCLICHQVPVANEPFQGDLGPNLDGVGTRLDVGQIRMRLVDMSRLNPTTLMPPYYRIDGLIRVAEQFRGRPVLTAQEIEDVAAWLASLK